MKITAFACPRDAVATLAVPHSETFAGLSRLIGRPAGYLGRFVRLGRPAQLRPDERDRLARYFGQDVRDFGEA